MAIGEIHAADIGVSFIVTLRDQDDSIQDISGATTKQLKFRKPNSGTVITKSAAFTTDGTDGKLQWSTTSVDDLDESGLWVLQAYLVIGSNIHHSDTVQFTVYPNLD